MHFGFMHKLFIFIAFFSRIFCRLLHPVSTQSIHMHHIKHFTFYYFQFFGFCIAPALAVGVNN